MVFSVEGRILTKVWPANCPDLNPVDYRISGAVSYTHLTLPTKRIV